MKTSQHGRSNRREGDEGAVAVEFALIAPVLAALVFGIIYFGILLASILGTNNAAREGARFGVVSQRTCADIAGQVQRSLTGTIGVSWPVSMDVTRSGASKCSGVSIPRTGAITATTTQVCQGSNNSTDAIQVIVRTGTGVRIPFLFSRNFTVAGKGVFRCEYT